MNKIKTIFKKVNLRKKIKLKITKLKYSKLIDKFITH